MNADSFFTIGSTHHICQDYSISCPEKKVAIICDGCSAARDTDIGARLLAKAAISSCQNDINSILQTTLNSTVIQCRAIGLPISSLLATFMMARCVNNNFITNVVGDGVVVGIQINGIIDIVEYIFPSGAPYYLAYNNSTEEQNQYFCQFGSEYTIRKSTIYENGIATKVLTGKISTNEYYFTECFPINLYHTVLILSDGAQSFVESSKNSMTGTQTKPVAFTTFAKELLDFKNYTGQFILRRCQRALKIFKDNNLQHMDDFSMAAITQR